MFAIGTLAEVVQAERQQGGNIQVVLCERGIKTFTTHSRNTLDISAVPALKAMLETRSRLRDLMSRASERGEARRPRRE